MTEFLEAAPGTQIYAAEQVLTPAQCSEIISRFEAATEEQYQGRIGQSENVNLDIKRSTDLVISGKPHWKDVDQLLFHKST